MNPEIQHALQEGIKTGQFTACSLAIQLHNQKMDSISLGTPSTHNSRLIDDSSFFDLASLTKVIFTTTLYARLYERQIVDLDQPLIGILNDRMAVRVKGTPYEAITPRDLLIHQAGFPGWVEYSSMFPHLHDGCVDQLDLSRRLVQATLQITPAYPFRTKILYSDVGFILLAEMASLLTHQTVEELWIEWIQKPFNLLGIKSSHQLTSEDVVVSSAPDLKPGEMNDPRARFFGRFSGHGSLFGNVVDVTRFGEMWLKAVLQEPSNHPILSDSTIKTFIQQTSRGPHLGWDRAGEHSTAGEISQFSFGHLGYTGTSLWIDVDRKAVVVLLTNRTLTQQGHSTLLLSESQKKSFNEFRRKIHNLVWRSLP